MITGALPVLHALITLALALWGWGGVVVNVTYADLSAHNARATTTPHWPGRIDMTVDPATFQFRLVDVQHEIGHGLGWFNRHVEYPHDDTRRHHSTDPDSVMAAYPTDHATITRDDFAHLHTVRMGGGHPSGVELTHHTTLAGIAR